MIEFEVRGDFKNTEKFLKAMKDKDLFDSLSGYARQGVAALASATPIESGITAGSWDYEIIDKRGMLTIAWTNSNVISGVNIAVILQYGHGTGTGGYVSGRDYINPAIQPIFDDISEKVWKAVTSA